MSLILPLRAIRKYTVVRSVFEVGRQLRSILLTSCSRYHGNRNGRPSSVSGMLAPVSRPVSGPGSGVSGPGRPLSRGGSLSGSGIFSFASGSGGASSSTDSSGRGSGLRAWGAIVAPLTRLTW